MLPSLHTLKFKYTWRDYQKKFLTNFGTHVADKHLHVIAPPGSGKTLLGIEILRQIGKKTLVLSPTLTIRNQWENRLQEFFTLGGTFTAVSFEITRPADITFSTYQGLYAFFKKMDAEEDYLAFFKKQGIETLVLDEAHHLKNAWWKALFALKDTNSMTIVALTATPPFDSDLAEIDRYFKLCGDIDDEIPVPELVKAGDLCPHQDFIHFSTPDQRTIEYIYTFRKKVADLVEGLQTNTEFIRFIKEHPFVADTSKNLEEIYRNPTYFSALLIFLNASENSVTYRQLKILGFSKNEIVDFPQFNNHWAEVLLHHLMFTNSEQLILNQPYLTVFAEDLKRLGVLKTNRINLVGDDAFYQMLSTSYSKLESIVEIISASLDDQAEDLRAVILTDYIRKEFLAANENEIKTIDKIGVVPIFQKVKKIINSKKSIGILSGSLIILPKRIAELLRLEHGEKLVKLSPLKSDEDYVNVLPNPLLTEKITQLFQEGKINILIGTKSYLGEGWDAPAINTLILASFVGSFVSSNQMRGRAIRSQKGNPGKTAVIWHLACIDSTSEDGGKDYETLTRRFDAFMGTSYEAPYYIENGLDRLSVTSLQDFTLLKEQNKTALATSKNSGTIQKQWKEAIATGTSLTRELKKKIEGKHPQKKQKRLYVQDLTLYGLLQLITSVFLFIPEFLFKNYQLIFNKGAIYFLYALLVGFFLGFGIKIIKLVRKYLYLGSIQQSMEKMGKIVLNTLGDLHYIADISQLKVVASFNKAGVINWILEGATSFESSLFINTLEELVNPVDNPRYLVKRGSWWRSAMGLELFYAVPSNFSDKKVKAACFLKHWEAYMGSAKIIYTRRLEGRKVLLKARLLYLKGVHGSATKKTVLWR